jgi:hypothetical protein
MRRAAAAQPIPSGRGGGNCRGSGSQGRDSAQRRFHPGGNVIWAALDDDRDPGLRFQAKESIADLHRQAGQRDPGLGGGIGHSRDEGRDFRDRDFGLGRGGRGDGIVQRGLEHGDRVVRDLGRDRGWPWLSSSSADVRRMKVIPRTALLSLEPKKTVCSSRACGPGNSCGTLTLSSIVGASAWLQAVEAGMVGGRVGVAASTAWRVAAASNASAVAASRLASRALAVLAASSVTKPAARSALSESLVAAMAALSVLAASSGAISAASVACPASLVAAIAALSVLAASTVAKPAYRSSFTALLVAAMAVLSASAASNVAKAWVAWALRSARPLSRSAWPEARAV